MGLWMQVSLALCLLPSPWVPTWAERALQTAHRRTQTGPRKHWSRSRPRFLPLVEATLSPCAFVSQCARLLQTKVVLAGWKKFKHFRNVKVNVKITSSPECFLSYFHPAKVMFTMVVVCSPNSVCAHTHAHGRYKDIPTLKKKLELCYTGVFLFLLLKLTTYYG